MPPPNVLLAEQSSIEDITTLNVVSEAEQTDATMAYASAWTYVELAFRGSRDAVRRQLDNANEQLDICERASPDSPHGVPGSDYWGAYARYCTARK